MPGFLVVPPAAASPGGLLNPSRVPFWGLNELGMSCNEDPLYYTDPWDTFFINDVQLPGKCWVENNGLAQIEVKRDKGKGVSGSRIKILGYDPKGFDALCRIATPEQWDIFQGVQDLFWAGPTRTAKPPQLTVKVRYPDVNRLRVYQAVLVGVPLSEASDVDGAKNFRFRFNENVPPKAVRIKVAGGPVPEDARLPSSTGPVNGKAEMPSKSADNTALEGAPLKTRGGHE